MITLITATPGSGKTLYAIKLIFDYLNQGRAVYTNILGLKIDGVRLFNISTPHLHDWRDLPNGSVIVYDEAHEHPAFASDDLISDKTILKKVRQDIGDSLALHRHFGFDFILISQKHDQIRSALYGFINKHIHLHRSFGLAAATVYNWRHVVTNPNAKTNRKDSEHTFTFRYPKYLYKYYNSAEQHTHKAQIPKSYIFIFIAILILLFVGFKMLSKSQLLGAKPENVQKTESTKIAPNQTGPASPALHPIPAPMPDYIPERRRIAFVIESQNSCKVYNGLGYRVSLSDTECREYANRERDLRPADPSVVESRLTAINYNSSSSSGVSPNVVKSEFVR